MGGNGRRYSLGVDWSKTCVFCEKVLSTSVTFESHISSHTGERPYDCNDCDATFSSLPSLITHRNNIHLGIKHKCQQCQKVFNALSNLCNHRKFCTGTGLPSVHRGGGGGAVGKVKKNGRNSRRKKKGGGGIRRGGANGVRKVEVKVEVDEGPNDIQKDGGGGAEDVKKVGGENGRTGRRGVERMKRKCKVEVKYDEEDDDFEDFVYEDAWQSPRKDVVVKQEEEEEEEEMEEDGMPPSSPSPVGTPPCEPPFLPPLQPQPANFENFDMEKMLMTLKTRFPYPPRPRRNFDPGFFLHMGRYNPDDSCFSPNYPPKREEENTKIKKKVKVKKEPGAAVVRKAKKQKKTEETVQVKLEVTEGEGAEPDVGDPNNKCDQCGKYYSSVYNLKKHMKMHTGIKPFGCHFCSKRFFEKCNVVRHIASMHQNPEETEVKNDKRRPRCGFCGERFSGDVSLLCRHMMTFHHEFLMEESVRIGHELELPVKMEEVEVPPVPDDEATAPPAINNQLELED